MFRVSKHIRKIDNNNHSNENIYINVDHCNIPIPIHARYYYP